MDILAAEGAAIVARIVQAGQGARKKIAFYIKIEIWIQRRSK